MANCEADVLSAVCAHKDINILFQNDVDILFRSHKDVWLGLQSYHKKYRSVPDVEILEGRFGNFESTKVSAGTQFYVDKLREDFVSSSLRSILLNTATALKTDSPIRVLEEMQSSMSEISRVTHIVKDEDITDYETAIKHFDSVRLMTDEFGGSPGIRTGLKAIDAAYPTGLAAGHFVVCLGYTGRAKSWFTMYLACKAWEQGFSPMIISLEMSIEDCRDRIYGLLGSGLFRVSDLQKGFIDADDMRAWGKKVLDNGPKFTIIANDGMKDVTPNIIASKIEQHNPDIVVLDYMQLASDNAKTKQIIERNTNLTNELKKVCMWTKKPMIAISAVTRDSNAAEDTPPRLKDVAWAKAIEYSCDLAMSVHKHDDTGIIEILADKNRRGPLFNFFLKSDLDRGIITETYEFEE